MTIKPFKEFILQHFQIKSSYILDENIKALIDILAERVTIKPFEDFILDT